MVLLASCHSCHQHLVNIGLAEKVRDDFLVSGECVIDESLLYKFDDFDALGALKKRNYKIWKDFKKDGRAAGNMYVADVSDFFYQARIFQKRGSHDSAVKYLDLAIERIYFDGYLAGLPKEYIARYYFMRAESYRRLKIYDRAIDDYQTCCDLGFKINKCNQFIQNINS